MCVVNAVACVLPLSRSDTSWVWPVEGVGVASLIARYSLAIGAVVVVDSNSIGMGIGGYRRRGG